MFWRKKVVWIIEDREDYADLLRMTINAHSDKNYEYYFVSSVDEIKDNAKKPSIVLMDIYDIHKKKNDIKSVLKFGAPVIVLTGLADMANIKYYLENGAHSCIQKPMNPKGFQHLVKMIEEVIDGKKPTKEMRQIQSYSSVTKRNLDLLKEEILLKKTGGVA